MEETGICQVCSEPIKLPADQPARQWVHVKNGRARNDGHFAWPKPPAPPPTFEMSPEGSAVAFW